MFWWELWFLSINRTCVCICEQPNNYAAFEKIPWELNGYESKYFSLGTNHLKIPHLSFSYLNIVRKMMFELNILSEYCKFVVFWWKFWFLSINSTCVCICEHLFNYAAFYEIPWELNGYETTCFLLGTNPLQIRHFSFLFLNIVRKMML